MYYAVQTNSCQICSTFCILFPHFLYFLYNFSAFIFLKVAKIVKTINIELKFEKIQNCSTKPTRPVLDLFKICNMYKYDKVCLNI